MRAGRQERVGDIVGERPAEQEFHREVIGPLGILLRIGILRLKPSLRNDVADRPGGRLVLVAQRGVPRIDDMVEDQVPLVECVLGSGNWMGPVPYC